MQISFSGIIYNPVNQPVQASIRFVQKGATSPYYNPVTEITTNPDGSYTFDINEGVYDIYIKTENKFYLIATAVKIDENTTAQTINDLI